MELLIEKGFLMPVVPSSRDMDDETFRKHLELRHIPEGDFSTLEGFHPGKHFSEGRPIFEVYHDHLHRMYDYDGHEHTED